MLVHLLHRLHGTVALVAGLWRAVLFDVTFVIELHVIGKHVDFLPSDRRVVVVSLCELLDFGTICRNNQVAVHANVQAWNGRVVGAFSRRVTVKTLHLVLTRMEFVRECNRLLRRVALVVTDRSPLTRRQRDSDKSREQNGENSAVSFYLQQDVHS